MGLQGVGEQIKQIFP